MSSSERKGYSIRTYLIAVLFIVAIAGSFLAGQYQENSTVVNADITQNSENRIKADLFNHMREFYLSKAEHHSEMIEVATAIKELEDNLDSLDSSHSHNEFSSLLAAIKSIRSDIVNIKSSINKVNPPSSGGVGFDLKTCSDYNCVDERAQFDEGETVYIIGNNFSNDDDLDIQVFGPNGDLVYNRKVSAQTHEEFLTSYQISDNAANGKYTIIIGLDGDLDQISILVD